MGGVLRFAMGLVVFWKRCGQDAGPSIVHFGASPSLDERQCSLSCLLLSVFRLLSICA